MKNKLEAANYPNNQDQTQGSRILSRPDEVPVSNRMLHTPRYVNSFLPSALAPSVTEALQEKNMLRNSSSGPQVRHPQRNLAGLPSRRNLNKPSGRPRAGPRPDFSDLPVEVPPASGSACRIPARKRYRVASSTCLGDIREPEHQYISSGYLKIIWP